MSDANAAIDNKAELLQKENEKQAKAAQKMQDRAEAFQKKQDAYLKRQEAISKVIEDRTTKRILLDDRLQKQRRMLEVGTRMGSSIGGGVGGSIFGFMQQIASMKVNDYQQRKDDLAEQKKMWGNFNSKGAVGGLKQKEQTGLISRIDKTMDKAFGGDSKWNKMFGGHGRMAAMGAGMGAAGAGLAIGKSMIDSSPLLQQMLKLMKFGFMLILKPIGDFFGFIMRPIMILLLRKFIIPFYQSVYPWFAKEGTKIGNGISDILDKLSDPAFWVLATGAVTAALAGALWVGKAFTNAFFFKPLATAVATAMGVVPKVPVVPTPTTTTTGTTTTKAGTGKTGNVNPTPKNNTPLGKFHGSQQNNPLAKTTGINTSGANKNIHSGTASTYSKNPAFKKVQKFMSRIGDIWDKKPNMSFNTIQKQISTFMAKQKGAAGTLMDQIKTVMSSGKFWNRLGQLGAKSIKGGGIIGVLEPLMYDFFNIKLPTQKEYDANYDENGKLHEVMGNGGMINERVEGIGQSTGKRYTLGEAGNEMVIPMSKMGKMGGGGTTVNITIGNMSGNANDLNKLRSTILEVMQTVNVNRGR